MIKLPNIREQFPIFDQIVHGNAIAYLDTASSSQKPKCVINAQSECYEKYYANVHRGVYQFSEDASNRYELTRDLIRDFIHANHTEEIIFTKGATESINLVAHSFARSTLKAGDTILISTMEHHANIVPWQIVCEQTGAKLRVIPINDAGELLYDAFETLLDNSVKIVAITQISNALGTINDINRVIKSAHAIGAIVLIDGTQGIVHQPVNVTELDADFYVFSSHKLYGPNGVGVLYGKRDLLNSMPPYQSGGDMIDIVTFEKTTYAPLPNKFEAGTPNISGVIAFGEAIKWIQSIGITTISEHEEKILQYATQKLLTLPTLKIIGTTPHKAGVISFILEGIHPHDIGTLLDHDGIAIRVGHHCAQPLMQRFNIPATARASFGVYTTSDEIDRLTNSLKKIINLFS